MKGEFPRSFSDVRGEWPPQASIDRMLKDWRYDRETYVRNLLDVRKVLDAHGVRFLLAFGTLLGAIRDGGPIEGDQDVDVMVTDEHEPKLVELFLTDEARLDAWKGSRFEVVRVSNHAFTVMRDACYVDVYLFRKKPDDPDDGMHWCCWQYRIDDWRIKNPWTMPLHGMSWDIPGQPESYLERVYGKWRVPVKGLHASS